MQIVTREDFLQTEAGASAKAELHSMAASSTYMTATAYDVMAEDNVTFIDRHINYLVKHPHIRTATYISNLKIMTKAKR